MALVSVVAEADMRLAEWLLAILGIALACAPTARADVVQFFDPGQTASLVASGVTSDTIVSNGYRFTYTRDKLFTGGTGQIIGRSERVSWPDGVEAQAVTTPPPGVTDYKARITLQRVDGDIFDLTAFTAKLLANTSGAGGSIEIMPQVDGEDGLADPLMFNVTGNYGISFYFDQTTPGYLGNTTPLKNFDTYRIGLYVDFALTTLTLEGAPVPEPSALTLTACIAAAWLNRPRRSGQTPRPSCR